MCIKGRMENIMESKFFNRGQIVVTKGINEAMMENPRFALEINLCLRRYSVKDCGNIDNEDKQVNEDALQCPDDLYLLGSYQTSKGKIWIITERISEKAGDNATTICYPDER